MRQSNLQCESFIAGADLSALQFTCVAMSGVNTVVSATAATAPVLGVLQNNPESGQTATVAYGGIVKVLAGGAITQGDKVTATTGGAVITTTTDTNHVLGFALDTAASGDYARVLITHGMVAG